MTALLQLGELHAEAGRTGEAREAFQEARTLSRNLGRTGYGIQAGARLALLDGSEPPDIGEGPFIPEREVELRWTLHRLARARGDQEEALRQIRRVRAILAAMAASLPEEERDAFWTRVTPNKEVGA